jgi:hypothetical protein
VIVQDDVVDNERGAHHTCQQHNAVLWGHVHFKVHKVFVQGGEISIEGQRNITAGIIILCVWVNHVKEEKEKRKERKGKIVRKVRCHCQKDEMAMWTSGS